jgi:heat shock protein HslJ
MREQIPARRPPSRAKNSDQDSVAANPLAAKATARSIAFGDWARRSARVCIVLGLYGAVIANAQQATEPAEEPPYTLEGEVWQLEEYLTPNGLKAALSGSGHRYATFDDGRFRINSGCSTLNGSYWLEGRRLMFSPHVASMLLDCPETLMAQEQAVLGLLGLIERFVPSNDGLTLMDASGKTLITLVRPDAVPLQGRVWRLTTYRDGNGTIVPALATPTFSLEFVDASNLIGQACDTYRAVFTRDEERLSLVGPVAVSRRGCAGSDASTQSIDYLAALEAVKSYQVDLRRLLLRDLNGRMLARFEPMDDQTPIQSATAGQGTNNLPLAPKPLLPALR